MTMSSCVEVESGSSYDLIPWTAVLWRIPAMSLSPKHLTLVQFQLAFKVPQLLLLNFSFHRT